MAQVEQLTTLRGVNVPEGIDAEEIIAWGDRLWVRCRINGYVVRTEKGSWMKVALVPLNLKKEVSAPADSQAETPTPPGGDGVSLPPPPESEDERAP